MREYEWVFSGVGEMLKYEDKDERSSILDSWMELGWSFQRVGEVKLVYNKKH